MDAYRVPCFHIPENYGSVNLRRMSHEEASDGGKCQGFWMAELERTRRVTGLSTHTLNEQSVHIILEFNKVTSKCSM